MATTKSKQVLAYLYKYALEKGTSEIIESLIPYGKAGIILWELGNGIYDIICSASDEDRSAILAEIQGLTEREIEQRLSELAEDSSVMNPMDISVAERQQVARGIYQTLRQIPNQRINPTQVINSINRSLFRGDQVLSVQNVHIASQSVGSAVVKTLVHGNQIKQRPRILNQQYPKINGFEIKGLLGEGAYAKVYLAKEFGAQEKICALKVGVLENNMSVEREVNLMKSIQHKNVLNCWDTGVFEEHGMKYYWISMPNMGGMTLEHLILGGRLDLETKLLILMEILDGLSALHAKGIVHRDLKPSNCLISNDFEIKISDFGLSKDLNNDLASSRSRAADAIGTPAYMSPEQIDGHNIGLYSDVWSIGMIAYEMFKGDLPWGRQINALAMTGKIQYVDIDIKDLNQTGISSQVLSIIEKCLKRDYNQRFNSAVALKENMYPLLKEDRNRIRHNRFKDSWHILLEKNLIEDFIVDQIKQGISEFKIDAFLAKPEIYQLSLTLDTERLNEVLGHLSQLSLKLGLDTFSGKLIDQQQLQIAKNLLLSKKEASLLAVEQELAQGLSNASATEIVSQLEILTAQKKQKKNFIEDKFNRDFDQLLKSIEENKNAFYLLVEQLKNQLKEELNDELKDFDQLKADQKKNKAKDQASKKTFLFTLSLLIAGASVILLQEYITNLFENEYVKKYMVEINGGRFTMGSNQMYDWTKPMHQVEIKNFYMSKTEVTVAQYRKCVDAGACSLPKDYHSNSNCNWGNEYRDNHPINCVNWTQAREFAKWVGGDLPTESQWEYASKSEGKNIEYPWGNDSPSCQYAIMEYGSSGCMNAKTWEVCSKFEGNTKQGICDMAGNVWEWVLDEYHQSYHNAPSDGSGWCNDIECNSNDKTLRVYRGGGWRSNAMYLHTTDRSYDYSVNQYDDLGFRVAKSIH